MNLEQAIEIEERQARMMLKARQTALPFSPKAIELLDTTELDNSISELGKLLAGDI